MKTAASLIVFFCVLFSGSECFSDAASAVSPAVSRPNIVLVVFDSLRADHLGCYGYHRPTSPAIDSFAASAVRFAFACASSSWTQPSVMSLFTSLPPELHGRTSPSSKHDPDAPALASELSALGYETVAITANPMLHRRYGYSKGFRHYDDYSVFMDVGSASDKAARKSAMDPVVTRLASAKIKNRDSSKPLFMLVFYMDPHWDYLPRPPYDADFGAAGYPAPSILSLSGKPAAAALSDRVVRAYDAEIRGSDDAFASLLEVIDSSLGSNRTAVVLCADHGESFWEHRNFTAHGNDLYDEELHVPLIIRPPAGVPFVPGSVVSGQAALVDVAPTLVAIAGGTPPASWAGRSLLASFVSGTADPVPVILDTSASGRHRRGVRDGNWKLIADSPFDSPSEVYNLASDPDETNNLFADGAPLPSGAASLVPFLKPGGAEIRASAKENMP